MPWLHSLLVYNLLRSKKKNSGGVANCISLHSGQFSCFHVRIIFALIKFNFKPYFCTGGTRRDDLAIPVT